MNALRYRIDLLEPMLAARLGGEPNSATSEPFVPGSMVRGAVVAAYLAETGRSRLDAAAADAQRLFFDGRTRYLNAYPLAGQDDRSLPIPWSWLKVKDGGNTIYDFALAEVREVGGAPAQFKAARGEDRVFCRLVASPHGSAVALAEGKGRDIKVHTQRERTMGRAIEGEGAVFQYDALPAGDSYVGAILADDAVDLQRLAGLLPRITSMGGSHNSGYGRVRVTVMGDAAGAWRETGAPAQPVNAGAPFVVTFLSDALLRDVATGQRTLDPTSAISNALGVALAPATGVGRSTARARNVGGFNRAWGLPLPQAQAISAGSAFVFAAAANVPADRVAAAEAAGIGERRAEGFGRFVIGWQSAATLIESTWDAPVTVGRAAALTGSAERVAGLMLDRLLRQQLDEALRRAVNELRIEHPPQPAQLSRLRVIARDALAELIGAPAAGLGGDAFTRLAHYLDNVKNRRSARDQFDRARVRSVRDSVRLNAWLDDLVRNPGGVWGHLDVSGAVWKLSNVERRADLRLAQEYAIRLIDGLLAKAARERRSVEDNGEERGR